MYPRDAQSDKCNWRRGSSSVLAVGSLAAVILLALVAEAATKGGADPTPAATADPAPPTTIVTSLDGDPLQLTLTLLAAATASVAAAVYKLEDPAIVAALRAAAARGVAVRLLVDGQEARSNNSLVAQVAGPGVSVAIWPRERGKLHAKLLVVDDAVATVGSYNWTASGRDSNVELLLVVRDGATVTGLGERFARLWALAGG